MYVVGNCNYNAHRHNKQTTPQTTHTASVVESLYGKQLIGLQCILQLHISTWLHLIVTYQYLVAATFAIIAICILHGINL